MSATAEARPGVDLAALVLRGDVQAVAAACDARQDRELVVIARTDVMDDLGLDEAIAGAKLYVASDVPFFATRHGRTIGYSYAIVGAIRRVTPIRGQCFRMTHMPQRG